MSRLSDLTTSDGYAELSPLARLLLLTIRMAEGGGDAPLAAEALKKVGTTSEVFAALAELHLSGLVAVEIHVRLKG